MTGTLEGLTILVTRPLEQAKRAARAIEAAGGVAFVFPTIEIQPAPDRTTLIEQIDRLDAFDWAIFVSANAVDASLPLILQRRALPRGLRFAAVGNATAAALAGFGVHDVIAPADRHDSEGLLALAEMRAVRGCRIVIFRGASGRELIADTLTERGAEVEYAVCYRRVRPEADSRALQRRWRAGQIHAVSAMSAESLTNLCAMIDATTRELLAQTPVFVPHERIAAAARALGLREVHLAGHGDQALIESILRWTRL